ncbi:glycosyltransferase [Acinetobacter sp. YH12027]|uniref:glycosyltransferase n=1 Tax=Acinetobacter sp. YH12027 TaxID=2601043 RepID=UPI0015D3CC88|nr:glycosyltransferase [Acinetobacter sp. YH12027]
MNILLYNFVQFDDQGSPGGGVSVYLRNLVNELINQGHNVYFLSAGDRYDFFRKEPFLKFYSEGRLTRCIIYNSPFIAPSASSFHRPDIFTSNIEINSLADDLYKEIPEIDVFHFHNIEGLTFNFIENLRNIYKKSKFIFSVHNYNLLCMQVNLWYKNEKNCLDYSLGENCLNCVKYNDISLHERKVKFIQTFLKERIMNKSKFYNGFYSFLRIIFKKYRYLFNLKNNFFYDENSFNREGNSKKFEEFRLKNIYMCKEFFDEIICVSERTKEVLIKFGFSSENISVNYIGTKFYSNYKKTVLKGKFDDKITIGYLGYMRSDKGFDFFLDAIESMSIDLANKINIVVAAGYRDQDTLDRLETLKEKFEYLKLYNGYNHKNILNILESIDVGIIPVQWEDNLPQVAIELVSSGTPILTSDLGGASEIFSKDTKFIFKHNDVNDFYSKLEFLTSNPGNLSLFWRNQINIFSMDSHLNKLMINYYNC